MAEGRGTEEYRRPEALLAVATLAMHEPEFLNGMKRNADGSHNAEATLWKYGFALSPWELQEVKGFIEGNDRQSDEEIVALLEGEGSVERTWR